MIYGAATSRRLMVLCRILKNTNYKVTGFNIRAYVSDSSVSIGEVDKPLKESKNPEYIPQKYYYETSEQSTLHHLRWMMQKDLLGQDIFLIGPPGPRRRNLAMEYLELTKRELEYVAINRDTTESDLKQRREIVSGTATYFDQSAVRAATEGRILVLEGIEKAERNVLPVLNNLLENREMHLEDGRLLIPAEKYDKLLQEHSKETLEQWKLVRVNEDFRVIALGIPIPKYTGNPLDPPLRSRFQARDVTIRSYQEWVHQLTTSSPTVPLERVEQLLGAAFGLLSPESAKLSLPDFPVENLIKGMKILEHTPSLSIYNILYRLYPYKTFLKEGAKSVELLLDKFKIRPDDSSVSSITAAFGEVVGKILNPEQIKNVVSSSGYVETKYQNKLIEELLQTNSVGDFCLIGPRGCGKNMVVQTMANSLGKEVENIVLYHDMTSRDLIQQRTTLDNGDTVWRYSPLILAAMEGKIAVLDGIHRIHPSTLSVLHRLVHDREIQLHDGKRLMSDEKFRAIQSKYNLNEEYLSKSGIFRIHPDFRIIALAEPPNFGAKGNWLTTEVLSLFIFHEMRTLSKEEELHVIRAKYGDISKPLQQIIDLAHVLRTSSDQTLKNLSGHLSTRQILRIASRMAAYPVNNSYDTIHATFMSQFLPPLARQGLDSILGRLGIEPDERKLDDDFIKYFSDKDTLTIGQTTAPIYKTKSLSKVPDILFYDVPQHISLLEKILQDFQLGYHLLLVGNQGVGKNKIIDRFLQLLNKPREYIQLHRDTTVQTLTVQPMIKDGLLVHEDSPLIKAIKYGHVLVVDEADKAPTHVTCILKTLVESGHMILSDGRRIVGPNDIKANSPSFIRTHPDFRMIVLANRPGFPFLGNDFFGALGDLFSCHAVDNPSKTSEIELLKQYGPDVSDNVIKQLVAVFSELRTMADQGLVSYPYSTREVVNVVKHLQKFPTADIIEVLFNVFDFDRYSKDVVETLGQVLVKHGFPKDNIFTAEYISAKRAKQKLHVTVNSKSGKSVSSPKHGKEDPENKPHVGGNTWAGGTGGRDTAGLGGKGGPYRLDKGHQVHQLSQEEIDAIPDHVKAAAREMGRKAFQEKLKEIGMSGYDAHVYNEFSDPVQRQVQSLRVILSSLQAKNKERHWYKNQTSGELDDVKLIDGLLGEKTVFRRRAEHEPEPGDPQLKPKMLRLVVDVSGSMYRFNSHDGRLTRELEAVLMVMEAFEGFSDKIQYDIIGHSGEAQDLPFVVRDKPPKNNKERLDVLRLMHAHAQYTWSGDHTLEAAQIAVDDLTKVDCDEAFLVILSDANLQRYGISPAQLGKVLMSQEKVSSYAIFIGSLGDQAERLTANLPAGRSFICTDVSTLPQILKQMFSSSIMNST